jgi:hypothetical protein
LRGKLLSKREGRAETSLTGNRVDWHLGGFQQLLRACDALGVDRFLDGRARRLPEAPRKSSPAHATHLRKCVERQELGKALACPFPYAWQSVLAGKLRHGLLDLLSLPALPKRRCYQHPRRSVRDIGTMTLPDEVQAAIDRGDCAGRGDDVPVCHV